MRGNNRDTVQIYEAGEFTTELTRKRDIMPLLLLYGGPVIIRDQGTLNFCHKFWLK